jgi:VWFA-related protein
VRRFALFSAFAAFAILGQPGTEAAAQAPPAGDKLSEQIDVRVTSIDFVALDAKGEPVSGLDPKSIAVVENGTARPVTNFTEVRRGPDATPGATQQRLAIFFDDNSLTASTRKRIIDAAKTLVKNAARRGDLVEIVTSRSQTMVRQAWTSEPATLLSTLDAIAKEVPGGDQLEAERRRVQSQINTMIEDGSGENAIPTDINTIVAGVRHYAEQRSAEFDVTAVALGKYVESLARLSGKKVVVIATESFPILPGNDMYQYLTNVQQVLASNPSSPYYKAARKASPMSDATRLQKTQTLASLAQAANQSGVTVYGVNPKGPGSGKAGAVETYEHTGSLTEDFAVGLGGVDGLQMLASATGGSALVGTRPQKALEQLDARLRNYYSIGYRSDLAPGAPRSVEITTTAKGVTLRYAKASTEIAVSARRTSDDLLVDPPANDIAISVERGQSSSPSPDRRIVELRVMIPVDGLKLEQNPAGMFEGGFSVLIQFRDRSGATISALDKAVQKLSWSAADFAAAKGMSITFLSNVTVFADRDQLTVRVVDDKSQKAGQASIDLSAR